MYGGMYEVDDELTALLIEAHRNIGFLEGFTQTQSRNRHISRRLISQFEIRNWYNIPFATPTINKYILESRAIIVNH